ncbi:3-hydroxyacyl-CoA dehydrogenase NAD-binding domain-containing protein [Rhodococcus koreensis]
MSRFSSANRSAEIEPVSGALDGADERRARRDIEVAVVGAGFIGCSFAAVFARAGYAVSVFDVDSNYRDGALEHVSTMLKQTGDENSVQRVRVVDTLEEAASDAVWIQECVPENLEIKAAVFASLDQLARPDAVLASSASELTMSAIADGLLHPERCVVVHPTNPPHLLRFVEVVGGVRTSPEIVDRAVRMMTDVGQCPATLNREVPGFILNRLQVALEREAFALLSENVATVAAIDAAVSEGLGPRWASLGPFAVEETNSASIRDGLTRFRDYFNNLFDALDRPFAGVNESFVELAHTGVLDAYGENCRDDLMRKRDDLLLLLRNSN